MTLIRRHIIKPSQLQLDNARESHFYLRCFLSKESCPMPKALIARLDRSISLFKTDSNNVLGVDSNASFGRNKTNAAVVVSNSALPYDACWFLLLAIAGCIPSTSTHSPHASSHHTKSSEMPIKGRIDLGVISPGATTRYSQWIFNQSDSEINVSTVETSCECLTAQISKSQLKIGDKLLIHLTYDGTKEPDFVGELQLEVTLKEGTGKIVGAIVIALEVASLKLMMSDSAN